VLIVDEPTAGLDPNQVRHFREHIADLRKTKTMLMSTHILSEVMAVADRVILINNGRLIFDGKPADLTAEDLPRTRSTAGRGMGSQPRQRESMT
jgi:ABC-2 type transport system ATP-binding protein